MQDKFKMAREQNITLAKRNIIDYIWKSANLEGIAVTFPQTEAIYNNLNVGELKVDEVIAINNLKHSWDFILSNLDVPTDYPLICKINKEVGGSNLIYGAGQMRNIPVKMGGTTWTPDGILFEHDDIKSDVEKIMLSDNSVTENAIDLMLYCMRKQIFIDGNKRTAMLAANHLLIKEGCGVISISLENQTEFRELLIKFYESNNSDKIKQFVYDNCLDY